MQPEAIKVNNLEVDVDPKEYCQIADDACFVVDCVVYPKFTLERITTPLGLYESRVLDFEKVYVEIDQAQLYVYSQGEDLGSMEIFPHNLSPKAIELIEKKAIKAAQRRV